MLGERSRWLASTGSERQPVGTSMNANDSPVVIAVDGSSRAPLVLERGHVDFFIEALDNCLQGLSGF
jgi:hypothetical protein